MYNNKILKGVDRTPAKCALADEKVKKEMKRKLLVSIIKESFFDTAAIAVAITTVVILLHYFQIF